MRSRRWLLSVGAFVLVALAACGGNDAGAAARSSAEPGFTPDDLERFVVRADEAPEGVELLIESSGELGVDGLWPDDCCPAQQEIFRDAGFVAAYGAAFQKPGHSGDPIDTRPGWEILRSHAVLFATEVGASSAMHDWRAYYKSSVLDPLPTDGLGDEAIAVVGSPNAPAEVFYLYLWRIDRLVLSLRASVGRGSVSTDEVRAFVDRMDARAT